MTTPSRFRNSAASGCSPSTPILSVVGDSTHGRPHPTETPDLRPQHSGRFRPKCIAAAGLPVPTPEAGSGVSLRGPRLPPAGAGGQHRGRGLPGAVTPVPLGVGWKLHERRPRGLCCAGVSRSHQSLPLLTTKETCDRSAKTLSVTHPWPMGKRQPLPGAHWAL